MHSAGEVKERKGERREPSRAPKSLSGGLLRLIWTRRQGRGSASAGGVGWRLLALRGQVTRGPVRVVYQPSASCREDVSDVFLLGKL